MKKYKIGVFGSSAGDYQSASQKAKSLGKVLAQKNCTIITGASSGLPYLVAFEGNKNGAEIIGFSPELNMKNQKLFMPNDDISIYKKIIYVPKSFPVKNFRPARQKYRNVISTANCDAGIIVSGRWGSLNEFTNLIDMGKIIGVLTGTGGIADELKRLNKKIIKEL